MPHRDPKALVRVPKQLAEEMKIAAAFRGVPIYKAYEEAMRKWLKQQRPAIKKSQFCKTMGGKRPE